MRVALRVEVCSLRGLRQGVPNLMRLFSEYQVRASFFFALGPDLAGRTPLRSWRNRSRVGLAALAYGTLMPAPVLGQEGSEIIAAARASGHETGVCGWSPQQWSKRLAYADEAWVHEQCDKLWSAHLALNGTTPSALATPGWQVHPALLRELSMPRYRYSSLSRGKFPFLPLLQGARCEVPEVPTTLPTTDELLRQPGVSIDNVHEFLYAESRHLLPAGHVFSLTAEREGIELLALMEKLLVMWKGQDGAVRALGDVLDGIELASLPCHQLGWARRDGSTDAVATQSVRVPV
jgi:peptidoglycan/xylan/chitin deacetylase (PgdA/CDA1 family)